jgi:hypothetical protein
MGTPFNDQWGLLRSSGRRRSDRTPAHRHLASVPLSAPHAQPDAQEKYSTLAGSARRRLRRRRWIDRDT